MADAFDGPTPGSSASTATGAVLRLTTPSIPFPAQAELAASRTAPEASKQASKRAGTPGFRRHRAAGCHIGEQKAVCRHEVAESSKAPAVPVARQMYPPRQSSLLEQTLAQ